MKLNHTHEYLPGTERYTQPSEIKALSKFLGEVKRVQEEHTGLEEDNLMVPGEDGGGRPRFPSPITSLPDHKLPVEGVGQEGVSGLEDYRENLRDTRETNLEDTRLDITPEEDTDLEDTVLSLSTGGDVELPGDAERLVDPREPLPLEDTRLDITPGRSELTLETDRGELPGNLNSSGGESGDNLDSLPGDLPSSLPGGGREPEGLVGEESISHLPGPTDIPLEDTRINLGSPSDIPLENTRLDITPEKDTDLEDTRLELSGAKEFTLENTRIGLEGGKDISSLPEDSETLEDALGDLDLEDQLSMITSEGDLKSLEDSSIEMPGSPVATDLRGEKIGMGGEHKEPSLVDYKETITSPKEPNLEDQVKTITPGEDPKLQDKKIDLKAPKGVSELPEGKINITSPQDTSLEDKVIEIKKGDNPKSLSTIKSGLPGELREPDLRKEKIGLEGNPQEPTLENHKETIQTPEDKDLEKLRIEMEGTPKEPELSGTRVSLETGDDVVSLEEERISLTPSDSPDTLETKVIGIEEPKEISSLEDIREKLDIIPDSPELPQDGSSLPGEIGEPSLEEGKIGLQAQEEELNLPDTSIPLQGQIDSQESLEDFIDTLENPQRDITLEDTRLDITPRDQISSLPGDFLSRPGVDQEITSLVSGSSVYPISREELDSLEDYQDPRPGEDHDVTLEDTILGLTPSQDTPLEDTRLDLEDLRENSLEDTRLDIEDPRENFLGGFKVGLEVPDENELEDKRINLEDRRRISLVDLMVGLEVPEENLLEDERIDLEDPRENFLDYTRKVRPGNAPLDDRTISRRNYGLKEIGVLDGLEGYMSDSLQERPDDPRDDLQTFDTPEELENYQKNLLEERPDNASPDDRTLTDKEKYGSPKSIETEEDLLNSKKIISRPGQDKTVGDLTEDTVGVPEYSLSGITWGNGGAYNPSTYLRWAAEKTVGQIPLRGVAKQKLIDETLHFLVWGREALERASKSNRDRLPGDEIPVVSDILRGASPGKITSKLLDKLGGSFSKKVDRSNSINRPSGKGESVWEAPGQVFLDSQGDGKRRLSDYLGGNRKLGDDSNLGMLPFGIGTTIQDLISGGMGVTDLESFRDALRKSRFITTPEKFTSTKNTTNYMTLDSNHVWEIFFRPYVGKQNGHRTWLPSFLEIDYQNKEAFNFTTHYSRGWLPITGFELQEKKLTSKDLPLYDGSISYPISMEFTNEIRITFADDSLKSLKRYFDLCAKVSAYMSNAHKPKEQHMEIILNGEPATGRSGVFGGNNIDLNIWEEGHDMRNLYDIPIDEVKEITNPTVYLEGKVHPGLYKNLSFLVSIYVLTPQYATVKKCNLLCVLKDYTIENQGEIDSSSTELNITFSIVGENPDLSEDEVGTLGAIKDYTPPNRTGQSDRTGEDFLNNLGGIMSVF